jgi:four helix bundle protein
VSRVACPENHFKQRVRTFTPECLSPKKLFVEQVFRLPARSPAFAGRRQGTQACLVLRVRERGDIMKKVEDLDVFKLSHSLALEIFEITKSFPEEEKFGLISQMRRAAYSVPMNLMEGANRLGSKEYRQFVGIAKGSAGEIKYQLLLARDLGYICEDKYSIPLPRYERVSQMLPNLSKSLD